MSIAPVSAATGTPSLRAVVAPVATVTSGLAHATTAPSALLALPRTLTQPVVTITRTNGILSPTLAGLTGTTTALTQAAAGTITRAGGILSPTLTGLTGTTTALTQAATGTITRAGSILSPTLAGLTGTTTALTRVAGTLSAPALVVSLGPLAGTVEVRIPTETSATAVEFGTVADRFPTIASAAPLPPLLGGGVRDLVLDGTAQAAPVSPGPSGASALAVGADGVPRRDGPGAPIPGTPAAPATPAGGTGGSGVSAPTGVLVDSVAFPATLTVLVLIACARRWAWWFPEVAIGPD